MPEKTRSQERYSYSFRTRADYPGSPSFDGATRDEIQAFVNTSLGMMTGGCDVCEFAHRNNSPALFCEKKKSPVNWGSPRCDYFIGSSSQIQDVLT